MSSTQKRSVRRVMRNLHRDLGFLAIGLTILFSVSGVVLVYRNTNVFKYEKHVAETWDKGMDRDELYDALPFRRINPVRESNDTIYFAQGQYCRASGMVEYSYQSYPWLIRQFNFLHKSISKEATHWIATLYGVVLLFLAISSFWMFKPGSKNFKRGLIIGGLGIMAVFILLFFL